MNYPLIERESASVSRPAWIAFHAVLALVTLLAAWPRVNVAREDSLWLDELHTGWVVSGPWAEVSLRAAEGNQAPVYFWFTTASVQLTGLSELGLRSVSLLAGCLAVFVAAAFVFQWTRSLLAGWTVAILISCDESMIWYASEARPYGLLMLAGFLQMFTVWKAVDRLTNADQASHSNRSFTSLLIAYGPLVLLSWLVVYIHYTGGLLLAAEMMIIVWWLLNNKFPFQQHSWRTVLIVSILIAIGLVPLWWQVGVVAGRRGNWDSVASMERLVRGLELPLLGWILVPGTLLMFFQPADRRLKSAIWLTGLVPLLVFLLIVLSQVSGVAALALPRYFSVAMILPAVFAGLVIGTLRQPQSRVWLAALLLIGSGIVLWNQSAWWRTSVDQLDFAPMRQEGWQEAIDSINSDVDSQQWPVVLFAGVIEDAAAHLEKDQRFQQYLLFPVNSLHPILNRPEKVSAGSTLGVPHFSQTQLNQIEQAGGAWILIRHQQPIIDEIIDELSQALATSQGPGISIRYVQPKQENVGLVTLVAVEVVPSRATTQ